MTNIDRLKELAGLNESTRPERYNDVASTEYGIINRQIDTLTKALNEISKFNEPFQKYAQPAVEDLETVIANLKKRRDRRGKGLDMARQKMSDLGHDMTGYTPRKK